MKVKDLDILPPKEIELRGMPENIGFNDAIDYIANQEIPEEKLKELGYIHKSKLLGVEEIKNIIEEEYRYVMTDEGLINNNDYKNATINVMREQKKWIAKAIVQAQEKGLV